MKRGTINMRSAYFVLQCIYIHLNNRRPEFHFGRGRLFHVNFRSTKYSDMKMFAKNLPSNRLSRPLLHQREQWTRGQLGPIIIIINVSLHKKFFCEYCYFQYIIIIKLFFYSINFYHLILLLLFYCCHSSRFSFRQSLSRLQQHHF